MGACGARGAGACGRLGECLWVGECLCAGERRKVAAWERRRVVTDLCRRVRSRKGGCASEEAAFEGLGKRRSGAGFGKYDKLRGGGQQRGERGIVVAQASV